MEQELISLFFIGAVAFLCPVLSALVPNKLIPETVFLLVLGMVLGPHVANLIIAGDAISLLSDLGLAFLFLLAGYELQPSQLTGPQGRHGLLTWIITFALALGAAVLWPGFMDAPYLRVSIAICLCTTAYGTIVPILHERKLVGTRIGEAVVAYGVWGELGPVIAMALLLSSRSILSTGLILCAFTVIAILFAFIPKRVKERGGQMAAFIKKNAETNSQMTVRAVVVLLVGLVCISAIFGLDIVLGSFAAGFALRAIMPEGDRATERKLQGIAYGFFVPLFFVVSGANIDPTAVMANPLLLIVFVAALLLIRAVPIYVGLALSKESRCMDGRERATIALYCTTALPLIVAVTSVATASGAMTQDMASVLVSAGAITVLLMPFLASLTLHTIDAEMSRAVKEVCSDPRSAIPILRSHLELDRSKGDQLPHVFKKRNHDEGEDANR